LSGIPDIGPELIKYITKIGPIDKIMAGLRILLPRLNPTKGFNREEIDDTR